MDYDRNYRVHGNFMGRRLDLACDGENPSSVYQNVILGKLFNIVVLQLYHL